MTNKRKTLTAKQVNASYSNKIIKGQQPSGKLYIQTFVQLFYRKYGKAMSILANQ